MVFLFPYPFPYAPSKGERGPIKANELVRFEPNKPFLNPASLPWHGRGQGFESPILHHRFKEEQRLGRTYLPSRFVLRSYPSPLHRLPCADRASSVKLVDSLEMDASLDRTGKPQDLQLLGRICPNRDAPEMYQC